MATVADFQAYVLDGPQRGRDWDYCCQAFVYNLCETYGHAPVIYPTATAAYNASQIVSMDPTAAPAGSFHYWAPAGIPEGHVAIGLGGDQCAMAVKEWLLDDVWATNVGTTRVSTYASKGGGRYLGWSYTNGENDVDMSEFGGFAARMSEEDEMTPDQVEKLNHLYGVSKAHSEAINEIRALVQRMSKALPGIERDAHGAHESADVAAWAAADLRHTTAEQRVQIRDLLDKLDAEAQATA